MDVAYPQCSKYPPKARCSQPPKTHPNTVSEAVWSCRVCIDYGYIWIYDDVSHMLATYAAFQRHRSIGVPPVLIYFSHFSHFSYGIFHRQGPQPIAADLLLNMQAIPLFVQAMFEIISYTIVILYFTTIVI